MSGYTVFGHPMYVRASSILTFGKERCFEYRRFCYGLTDDRPRIVTARSPPKPRAIAHDKSLDMRRNLYILGLPPDLSK